MTYTDQTNVHQRLDSGMCSCGINITGKSMWNHAADLRQDDQQKALEALQMLPAQIDQALAGIQHVVVALGRVAEAVGKLRASTETASK